MSWADVLENLPHIRVEIETPVISFSLDSQLRVYSTSCNECSTVHAMLQKAYVLSCLGGNSSSVCWLKGCFVTWWKRMVVFGCRCTPYWMRLWWVVKLWKQIQQKFWRLCRTYGSKLDSPWTCGACNPNMLWCLARSLSCGTHSLVSISEEVMEINADKSFNFSIITAKCV